MLITDLIYIYESRLFYKGDIKQSNVCNLSQRQQYLAMHRGRFIIRSEMQKKKTVNYKQCNAKLALANEIRPAHVFKRGWEFK